MKHLHRRRFLSICSLTVLSLGVYPRRLLSQSNERTPQYRSRKTETTEHGFIRATVNSRGQGASFEAFLSRSCTIELQHGLDDGAIETIDTTPPEANEVGIIFLQPWQLLNLPEASFRWTFDAVLLNDVGQETDQLDVSGYALGLRGLHVQIPMRTHTGSESALLGMLRMHAPSLSKPIPIALTRTRDGMEGRHDFNDREIKELYGTINQLETVEFDFYDTSGFESLAQAEAVLPRNHRPRFRIQVAFKSGQFKSGLGLSGRVLNAAISDIREGKGVEQAATSCYLTTAACDAVGLPDDCWELQTLRRFRDTVLPQLSDGNADIAHYYAEAPAALARLRQQPDAQTQLLKIYWQTILPCALLAKMGAHKRCHRRYRKQHRKLVSAQETSAL